MAGRKRVISVWCFLPPSCQVWFDDKGLPLSFPCHSITNKMSRRLTDKRKKGHFGVCLSIFCLIQKVFNCLTCRRLKAFESQMQVCWFEYWQITLYPLWMQLEGCSFALVAIEAVKMSNFYGVHDPRELLFPCRRWWHLKQQQHLWNTLRRG